MNCITNSASKSDDVQILKVSEAMRHTQTPEQLWHLADRLREIAADIRLRNTPTINQSIADMREACPRTVASMIAELNGAETTAGLQSIWDDIRPNINGLSTISFARLNAAYTATFERLTQPELPRTADIILRAFAGAASTADLDDIYRETYPSLRALSVEARLSIAEVYALRQVVLSANDGR